MSITASWISLILLCFATRPEAWLWAVASEGIYNDDAASCVVSNDVACKGNCGVPLDCTLVMAPSGIPNSGWGVFTLVSRKAGQRMMDQGDNVIHIPDPNPRNAHEMRRLIWDYLWEGQLTGGHYEGLRVMSAVSGFGALANGVAKMPSLIYNFPSVDDAGVKRGKSPGAGAFSHYHNFTWTAAMDLDAGVELFVEFGTDWIKERGFDGNISPKKFEVSHLRKVGYCLDNIVPGPSLIEGAGRGAFASRDLGQGATVAPVPLLALSRPSLQMFKERKDGSRVTSTQLLQNYCFGHANSSLLLYPYSHGVNFINHDSISHNVQLRWSKASAAFFGKPMLELQQSGTSQLMLELVTTRPIGKGEEITLDYGGEWEKAWNDHVESWQPRDEDTKHVSSETMNVDDQFKILRTQQEQQMEPYPEHVFTSCYYQYSGHGKDNHHTVSNSEPPRSVAKWKHEMVGTRNLRPCAVLQRRDVKDKLEAQESYLYTVHIMNRPTLDKTERIPKGHVHFVTHVPRHAIVFSDKTYMSDQHLEKSFRKEIDLADLFPEQWKDLL